MLEKLKKIKWGYIVAATLIFIVGLSLIISSSSLKGLTITVGVILSVYSAAWGAAVIITDKHKNNLLFGLKISAAVIGLIFGVVMAIMNERAVALIVSVICLVLIVDGSFKLVTAGKSKKYDVSGWWMILTVALISLVGGFLLLKFTPQSISLTAVLLGVFALVDGVGNLFSVYFVEEYEKNQERMIYYDVYRREMERRADDGKDKA